jgi:hypothetical protein
MMSDTSIRDATVIVDLIETVSCCFQKDYDGGRMGPVRAKHCVRHHHAQAGRQCSPP